MPNAHNARAWMHRSAARMTPSAFIVDDLEALVAWLERAGHHHKRVPHHIGPEECAVFIRDPAARS